MGFLDDLGSALSSQLGEQFGMGNGSPSSLDAFPDNSPFGNGNIKIPYGKLKDFAGQIDQSANRSYVENGHLRDIRPRALEIVMQQPDVTVVVKKRMFSSLAENYKTELMNSDEKLFLKASKRLFQNKCRAIAAHERLSKIEKIISAGVFNDSMLSSLFTFVDVLNSFDSTKMSTKTQNVFDTLKEIQNYSNPNTFTTWTMDQNIPYTSDAGEGTGTFELTTIASVNWTNTISLGTSSASITLEDPYKLMVIFPEDIDQAIADVTSLSQNSFFKLAKTNLEKASSDLKDRLNQERLHRGASTITFFVNEQSLLYYKVRAVIDGIGKEIRFSYDGGASFVSLGLANSVDIEPEYLIESTTSLDKEALTAKEAEIFSQIIENLFNLIAQKQTTQNQINQFNKKMNYVRNKMRLQFSGKNIVQPMDEIHIYVSSKTLFDSEISKGLTANFSNNSLVNKLNDTVEGIDSMISNIKDSFTGKSGTSLDIEKNAIVGEDFPTWLWGMIRNNMTRQAAGMHVFGGIVDSCPHTGSGNKYTMSISVKGNDAYFDFGQININPSVDVWNGDLYDPLTPFDTNFNPSSGFLDESPSLLDENKKLLNSGIIKARLGKKAGQIINEQSWGNGEKESVPSVYSNLFRTKFNDPYGFVYRWKDGIGTKTMFGEPHASSSFPKESSPNLYKDPFIGQNTINALSLLITGQPYDFNSFLKAALSSGSLSQEDLEKGGGNSYLKGLLGDLNQNNKTWGNFYPFKRLTINDLTYSYIVRGEIDVTTKNNKLNSLLKQRAARFDQLVTGLPELVNNPQFYNNLSSIDNANKLNPQSIQTIGKEIIELDMQIEAYTNSFTKDIEKYSTSQNAVLNIIGNDISFEPSYATTGTQSAQARNKENVRKKLNYLTQRRLWQVKANKDKNLFIVDDTYDKNHDIQAFEAALASGSFSTFISTYTTVKERIQAISHLLGLEVFANSQGHIEVRIPQYNRIPSSVFRNMLEKKAKFGIQLYPDYLESLFIDQISGLTDRIEIVEDQIRLQAAALGAKGDSEITDILSRGSYFGFVLVTDSNGKISSNGLKNLVFQSEPDYKSAITELKSLDNTISTAITSSKIFTANQRINLLNSNSTFTSITNNFGDKSVSKYIGDVSARLRQKGIIPPSINNLLGSKLTPTGISQLSLIKITETLSQLISERQSLLKMLSNSVRNLNQGLNLNADSNIAKNFLFSSLNKKSDNQFPEILEHIIEDEDYDDFGPNSGKRFIIKDSQIINITITEKSPDWTMVEVNGAIDNKLVDAPSSLGISSGGGNAMVSAFAVDYDMWRMYGFKQSHPVQAPFLSDPESQCAPYAVGILNMARKNILQGNVSMIGNEYIQPGEVYYIEDRDLLFYADSVGGSISYNSQFQTTMSLKYGHSPGEFIPNMLDILGKALYSRRNQADLVRHDRFGNSSGDISIGALVIDSNYPNPLDSLLLGFMGNDNRKTLYNLLLSTTGAANPPEYGKEIKIKLRAYYNSTDLHSGLKQFNANLQKVAEEVVNWVINPKKANLLGDNKDLLPDNTVNSSTPLDTKSIREAIEFETIDLAPDKSIASVSSAALEFARQLSNVKSAEIKNDENAKLREMLFKYVIDIWVTYEKVQSGVKEIKNIKDPIIDQATAQKFASYQESFADKILNNLRKIYV